MDISISVMDSFSVAHLKKLAELFRPLTVYAERISVQFKAIKKNDSVHYCFDMSQSLHREDFVRELSRFKEAAYKLGIPFNSLRSVEHSEYVMY